MKVVIAMDSFKGTLKADEACEIIAGALSESVPGIELVLKPMADGGEGTARAMMKASNGRWVERTVMGPLPEIQLDAGFAWFEDRTALVEMAAASGLEHLRPEQLNPLRTTTYGTGQLIRAALDYGARKILLAVGGSATVDGGLGAAAALGWAFLDDQGRPIPLGGAGLEKLATIVTPEHLSSVPVEVLCDCENPLCGEFGAAHVYGPQKGATRAMVADLDRGLAHLADIVRAQMRREICRIPGAGAAGGLAAGAIAFMNAALVSGIETVMARSHVRAALDCADWILTGEGCFDQQSLYGKVVSGILNMASHTQARTAILAGQVKVSPKEYQKVGLVTAIACKPDNMSLDVALANSRALLRTAAQKFAADYLC